MCSGCHLAPGLTETELSRGLYPAPPDFARDRIENAAQAFWAIKHGIKASGMPAWGKSMEDRYIWGMIALLQKLPETTPQQYRALVAASEGHSHGEGKSGPEVDSGAGSDEHSHDAGAGVPAPEDGHEEEHDHGDHPHEKDADTPDAAPPTQPPVQASAEPKE